MHITEGAVDWEGRKNYVLKKVIIIENNLKQRIQSYPKRFLYKTKACLLLLKNFFKIQFMLWRKVV